MTIPAIVQAALDEHDATRARILSLAQVGEAAEIGSAYLAFEGIPTRCYIEYVNNGAWLWGTFTSMEQVVLLRKQLALSGWHLIHGGQSDHPDHGYFTLDLHKEGVPGSLYLRCAMPDENAQGATCRYVKTGEKTVPVYELQCAK